MLKKNLRSISIVLVLALVCQLFLPSLTVFAEDRRVPDSIIGIEELQPDEVVREVIGEIPSLRGKSIKTYKNSDNTNTTEVFNSSVHYQNDDGVWEDINNSIEEAEDNGEEHLTNKANNLKVKLAKAYHPNQPLVSVKSGNHQLQITPLDGEKQSPVTIEKTRENRDSLVSQAVIYSDVYPGIDIEYKIVSDYLKENIIIREFSGKNSFQFSIKANQLSAVLEDNQVLFKDSNDETAFIIPAPFMFDQLRAESLDIQVEIEQQKANDFILTMTADAQWLSDPSRAYPVIIDPVVMITPHNSLVHDNMIASAANHSSVVFNNYQWNKVGYYNNMEITRTLLKFADLTNVHTISSADNIVSAEFHLYQATELANKAQTNIHKITEAWDTDTITWDNQPEYDSRIIDYVWSQEKDWIKFDITSLVKEWYETGINNGVVIKHHTESDPSIDLHSSIHYEQETQPVLSITYNNISGLVEYISYTTMSLGRSGESHVNNYNGNLIHLHEDLDLSGNLLPLSISHVYNSDSKEKQLGYGKGWQLNLSQKVFEETIAGTEYVFYTDSDGTLHEFKKEADQSFTPPSGVNLELKVVETRYTITDNQENKLIFNENGDLGKIIDNKGQEMVLTYQSDPDLLISVTDGANRVATLSYNQDELLTSISLANTSFVLFFEYDTNGNLQQITYPDSKSTTFDYNDSLLTGTTHPGGEKITYSYNASGDVIAMTNYGGDGTKGEEFTFTYEYNNTIVKDRTLSETTYIFNNWGNPVNIIDTEKNATHISFENNEVIRHSKHQETINNLLKNHNLETEGFWTLVHEEGSAATGGYSADASYFGNQGLYINKTNSSGQSHYSQTVNLIPGEDYTFSAHLKPGTISGGTGAHLFARYTLPTGEEEVTSIPIAGSATSIDEVADGYLYLDWDEYHFYGTTNDLTIWSSGFYNDESKMPYIKFDIDSIPAGANVTKAELVLSDSLTTSVKFYLPQGDWDEQSLGESYPNWGAGTFGSYPFIDPNLVQGWINGSRPNHGIILVPPNNYTSRQFAARETGNGPKLLVEYTLQDTGSDWDRQELSFQLPENAVKTEVTVGVAINGSGTLALDALQLEESLAAGSYNLVENNSFEWDSMASPAPDFWQFYNNEVDDGLTSENFLFNEKSLKITGNVSKTKSISQVINVSGHKDDTFLVGGWAKARAAAKQVESDELPWVSLNVDFHHPELGTTSVKTPFNNHTEEWQFVSNLIEAPSDYTHVTISGVYDYNVHEVYFDGFQLNKEIFTSYTYDENGNITSVTDEAGQTTTFEYDEDNNLTSATDATGDTINLTHNQHDAITLELDNFSASFAYDENGNIEYSSLINHTSTNLLLEGDFENDYSPWSMDGHQGETETIILDAVADGYIYLDYDYNLFWYGTRNYMNIRSASYEDDYPYLKFDFDQIPEGATITSATLDLSTDLTTNVKFYLPNGSWSDSSGAPFPSWDSGTFGNYPNLDPSLVQDWMSGNRQNHGIALIPPRPYSLKQFASKESGNAPKLIVEYIAETAAKDIPVDGESYHGSKSLRLGFGENNIHVWDAVADGYDYLDWDESYFYGTGNNLVIWDYRGDEIKRPYIKFNIPNPPSGNVKKAELVLSDKLTSDVSFRIPQGDWSEQSANVPAPSWSAGTFGNYPYLNPSLVQDWITGSKPNHGIILMPPNNYTQRQFSARETGNGPKLIVEFDGAPTPEVDETKAWQDVEVSPSTTYTLSGQVKSSLTDSIAYFQVQEYDQQGNEIPGASHDNSYSALSGEKDWTFRTLTFTTNENTAKVRVNLLIDANNLNAQGNARFDLMQLEEGSISSSFNLLPNSSFETLNGQVPQSYLWQPEGQGTLEIETEEPKTGEKSIKLTSTSGSAGQLTLEKPVAITPQRHYTVSLWAKSENITAATIIAKGYTFDSNGNPTEVISLSLDKDLDWANYSHSFIAPEDAHTFQLALTVEESGTVWFDDVALLDAALVQETTYTSDGNYIHTEKDPEGNTVLTYNYNSQEQLTRGLYESFTDAAGNTQNFTYDALDRLTSVSQGNIFNSYKYNVQDNLEEITRSDGMKFSFNYDAFSRLSRVMMNAITLVEHEYDASGLLLRTEYGNGQYKEYGYDSLYRLSEENWDGNPRFQFTYDARDNLLREVDLETGEVTRITYDLSDNPVSLRQDNRFVTFEQQGDTKNEVTDRIGTRTFTTAYTSDDDEESITMPSGKKVEMYNDGQGRLSKLLYHLSSTKLFSQMSYNNRGLLAELVHSENSYSYAYDALGNITEVAENDTLTEYRYDEYARLTDYIVGEDTTTYTYDDGNNLTGILNGKRSTSFSYQDDLLTAVTVTEGGQVVDNRTLQYDAGGNLINDGQQQYTWAAGRHLAGISGPGLSATYRYNSSGLRTEKTVNGVKSKYYYLDDKVVAEEIGDTLIYYTYAGDTPVGMEIDGVQYYYLTNGQGDVTHVVDDSGNVVASYEYDPWGRIKSSTGTEDSSPGYLNPYRYRGYRYDHESGLYYLQSRYYSPDWGRFISADDAAILQVTAWKLTGVSLYSYCEGDPVNKVDPSGYVPGNYWWNSKWFVSNAINAVIMLIIGGSLSLAASFFRKQATRYGAQYAATLFATQLKRSYLIRRVGYAVGNYIIKAATGALTLLMWATNPGVRLFDYLDSKEANKRTRNNGYLNF